MTPLIFVVIGCSFIQSLFGIGLLFVGTPLLLLLGYPFQEALLYLLPCSMIVSLLQVYEGRKQLNAFRRSFILFGLPFLLIGCLISFNGIMPPLSLKPIIGTLILVTALLRFSPTIFERTKKLFEKYQRFFMVLIGLVHGTTNMGGGLLTALVSSAFSEKSETRSHIAFGYLMMAMIQLLLLLVISSPTIDLKILFLPILSAVTYSVCGNWIFRLSPQLVYQHLMTFLLLLLAATMIAF